MAYSRPMAAEKLTPVFKTIADFGKDNLQPLQKVCRTFTLLCKNLDLFGGELIAIDGSKFKAANNRKRNWNAEKLARALQESDWPGPVREAHTTDTRMVRPDDEAKG